MPAPVPCRGLVTERLRLNVPSTHLYVKQDRLGSVVGLDGHMQLKALAGTGVACTAKQLRSNPNPPLSAEARSKRRKGRFVQVSNQFCTVTTATATSKCTNVRQM